MAADAFGKTITAGDLRVPIQKIVEVTDIVGVDAVGRAPMRIPAADSVLLEDFVTINTSAMGAGAVPIWRGSSNGFKSQRLRVWFDDFMHAGFNSSEWAKTTGGSGNAYVQRADSSSYLLDLDAGEGYMRTTVGSGTAATDYAMVATARASNGGWSNLLRGTGNVFRWRAAIDNAATCKHFLGLDRSTTASARPTPGYGFLFDSAYTNIQFTHDDGAGNSGVIDTGVTRASAVYSSNWYVFEVITIPTAIGAYIDNTLVALVFTNLPTGTNACVGHKQYTEGNGASWRSLLCDWHMMIQLTDVHSTPL